MPTAQITVGYVNQPKPGKKQGSIKTTDGQYFGVDPTQLSQFEPDRTYTIEYDTHIYQGKEYKTFRRMDGAAPAPDASSTGRPGQTKSIEMYVMAVIGKAVEGSGTVPDRETQTRWIKDCRWAWIDGFASIAKPEESNDY